VKNTINPPVKQPREQGAPPSARTPGSGQLIVGFFGPMSASWRIMERRAGRQPARRKRGPRRQQLKLPFGR
jgi:hypothetical protein